MLSEFEKYLDYIVVAVVAVLLYRWFGEPLRGLL